MKRVAAVGGSKAEGKNLNPRLRDEREELE
jgi:hypothetical protein